MSKIKHNGQTIDPSKINETVQVESSSLEQISLKESASGETFIMPRIEAIHAGKTRNDVYYPADKLKGDKSLGSGVYSWTQPYAKPVIYNHDLTTEVTGRVERAAYSEYTQAGKPGLILVPKITEKSAVEAVRDGRLLTVSIGASTNSATCSICGTDIIKDGFCGHMKGEEYDGEVAHWIVGDIFFEELSWVNQPADSNAFIVDADVSKETVVADTKENLHESNINKYYGVPKSVPLTESVASNVKDEEDKTELSKIDKLKEATKNAKKTLTEAELNIEDIELEYGQSAFIENTGEPISENAELTVDSDLFTVTINEADEVVLTAPEESEETSFDLTITITEDEEESNFNIQVTLVEEDDGETEESTSTDDGKIVKEDKETKEADETKEDEEPKGPTGVKGEPGEVGPKGAEVKEDLDNKSEAGEEDPQTTEEDDKETDKVIEEAVSTIEELETSNNLLKEQINLLTKELKENYIEKIIDKHSGEVSESRIETLNSRSLESLKETIQDIEEGFLNIQPVKEEKKQRSVKKIDNPIKENKNSKEDKKEITEQDKINIFKKFLK